MAIKNQQANQDLAIVYMVAGMSSRFNGEIKQFARVGPRGETLIEYSINQAKGAGFNRLVFIVGEKTEQPFKEMFGESYNNMKVIYAKQTFSSETRDKPWGTVDALCSAKEIIKCPFVVCNGDDIYGARTFKILANHLINPLNKQIAATAGYKLGGVVPEHGKTNRGIFQVREDYVTGITETFDIEQARFRELNLTPDNLTSMNIFALYPETIGALEEVLIKFQKSNFGNRKIECLLPVELSGLINQNALKMKLYASPDKWFGVTNPEDEEIVKDQLVKQELKQ